MGPHPRCIFQHWTALDAALPSSTFFRQTQLRSNLAFAKQTGMGALRASIQSALRGERVLNFSYLLIGAAFWPELEGLYSHVYKGLFMDDLEHRIAATFASAFFLDQEQLACLLAERVVVGEGDELTLQAAREVLEIISAVQLGGKCPRCGLQRTYNEPRVSDMSPIPESKEFT